LFTVYLTKLLERDGVAVTPLFYILEVLGSNLGRETGYFDWVPVRALAETYTL
jgi:hypothetical protein